MFQGLYNPLQVWGALGVCGLGHREETAWSHQDLFQGTVTVTGNYA